MRRPLRRRAAHLAGALAIVALVTLTAPVRPLDLVPGPAVAVAADPSPTPADAGDPRTSLPAPGFVGRPLLAIGGVIAIGLGAVLVTLVYVRLTDRDRG